MKKFQIVKNYFIFFMCVGNTVYLLFVSVTYLKLKIDILML